MRLFYSKGLSRTIDLDHVQEISDLFYRCTPSKKKKDTDGIEFDSKAIGHASFDMRIAFANEVVLYRIEFGDNYRPYNQTMIEASDEIVRQLELFKKSYEDLKRAWTLVDGSQPSFAHVLT